MSLLSPPLTQFAGALASAARTTAGNGVAMTAPGTARALIVWIGASAVTGMMHPAVEWTRPDGVTFALPDPVGDSFQTFSAPGSQLKIFTIRGAAARLSWAVGGSSPSTTFSADFAWLLG